MIRLDEITEELSFRYGGASVCVCPLDALSGGRELIVRGVGSFWLRESGHVYADDAPYGIWLYDRDWEPEEARG